MPDSVVVVTHAREMDYSRDYVSLPKEYGKQSYEAREDVQAIRTAVWENLQKLDAETKFTEKIRGKRVILKPNLVIVFHDLGMKERDYPESTDPRVIDAVVLFLQQYTRNIVIVESSGRGMPTQASFRIAGLDRLATYRGVELVALEEQPVDRYLLPKARVMQEMVVPKIFSEIVRGEAFYISMPKMKTNLYTGVTLGFKNAMGTIAYNLRQRNHTYEIDQKLVDMLHLFKADLVIIDGIVGGEGNCPAPVDPVQSRVIVSGNHSVETDRVATRMMGFDPSKIRLMQIADENGFNDARVRVIGEERVMPYRAADPSLLGSWLRENFPNVRVLVGQIKNRLPLPKTGARLEQDEVRAVEMACRGGCLATTRYAFDMLYHEGHRRDFHMTLLLGSGLTASGEVVYFDAEGEPYPLEHIRALKGKKMAVGTCAMHLKGIVNQAIDGCMPFPNSPHMVLHQLSGTFCKVMSARNRFLMPALLATLRACERRKALLRSGQRIDIPLRHADIHFQPRMFSQEDMSMDYIYEPFEPLTPQEIKDLCAAENRNILATFKP